MKGKKIKNKNLELNVNSGGYKWANKLSEPTLEVLHQLLVLYVFTFKPHVQGNSSVQKYQIKVPMTEKKMEEFYEFFDIEPDENVPPYHGAWKAFPFTKGNFERTRYTLRNISDVLNFLTIFKKLEPKSEIIALVGRQSKRVVYIEPMDYQQMLDVKDTNDPKSFHGFKKQEFPNETATIDSCRLVVGELKGMKGNFYITYTKFPQMDGGYLSLNFWFESKLDDKMKYGVNGIPSFLPPKKREKPNSENVGKKRKKPNPEPVALFTRDNLTEKQIEELIADGWDIEVVVSYENEQRLKAQATRNSRMQTCPKSNKNNF